MIVLPPLGELEDALWVALLDIAQRQPAGWTLVGGQMVLLHALEHGATPPRISRDLDLIADARVRPPAVPAMARVLRELGFALDAASPDEVGHRFIRGTTRIDLLAPERVGSRADLRVEGNTRTVMVPGGTFALARTELIDIQVAGRTGRVPRPDLAGAITIKAIAAHTDSRGQERHRTDLALLLSLVPDPIALADALTTRHRRHIADAGLPSDATAAPWNALPAEAAARGIATLGLLTAA